MYLKDAIVVDRTTLSAEYNQTLRIFKSQYNLMHAFQYFLDSFEENVKVLEFGNESNTAVGDNLRLMLGSVNNLLEPPRR